ncbi:hypothetical protein SAMD00019534_046930 [Acytostelium subglobosum LB1]|uniref:hypothetical protein n=1 Tax=Acytostelium subglobosum LB1 TaxID=1410327 RepID=UPI000644D4FC|nr:hypothetical protein SAMD00019534_046930 [Acytostelium subglobosum LB1]GAM21518.1 hypothetical protein SAMD00019534_046930 [Acytostelium subglobosum LB1]|eukprot:XP_012755637.1 hypothetical protein SAMD00019534_046930 [Acytostelium subglobosum LB1]
MNSTAASSSISNSNTSAATITRTLGSVSPLGLPRSVSNLERGPLHSNQQLQLHNATNGGGGGIANIASSKPAATSSTTTAAAISLSSLGHSNNNNNAGSNAPVFNITQSESHLLVNIKDNPAFKLKFVNGVNGMMSIEIDFADVKTQTYSIQSIKNYTKRYYFNGIINSFGKQPTICEDSHFLSNDFTTVGVADGVGSWRSVGVDSGEYSRGLMQYAQSIANEHPHYNPYELIEHAYVNTTNRVPGSSTICILKLSGSRLYSGLVGDSSFIVIRKDKVSYRSREQTHKPNCPYQLGQQSLDRPSNGDYQDLEVQENDIVVIGTDGFFDNVFDEEILEAIKKVNSIQSFFQHLADTARKKSIDPNSNTPHAVRYNSKGGKPDDITVGCFVITEKGSAAKQQ